MSGATQEGQTTPIVTGTDIFSFGAADVAPGPGESKEAEPATPAHDTTDHPGEADRKKAEVESLNAEGEKPPQGSEKPRFKDHAAAEDGYRNLQAAKTRAEQEAAELRKKLAEQEAVLRTEKASKETAQKQEQIDKAIEDYTAERNEKALEAIESLDPDDPEHRKKVARIWASFHADVRKFSTAPVDKEGKPIEAPVTAGEQKETPPAAEKQAADTDAAADANARSARTSPSDDERRAEIRGYIDSRARSAGINPDDDELWIGVSLTTPQVDTDGKRMSLDQQIEWTIKRYNERKAAIQSRARQAAALPLGEGGSPPREQPGGGNIAGPISLGDAVARANERRRL